MDEKKSIYFQRPNLEKAKTKPPLSDLDSEEESFSDVFKIKKLQRTTDIPKLVCNDNSQVNFEVLKLQSRASDADSTSSEREHNEESSNNEEYKKILQCPICLNFIQKKSNSWKVNHFKQCAIKHKVPTHKLMKALRVQRIQFEEREKLGLPNFSSEKQSAPRRNHSENTSVKQMRSSDPGVQLALALSASHQEAQEAALIEETANLFEAGLETEAMNCCKTLETLPACQLKPPTSKKDKASRANVAVPVLLSRSKEERERLISEKVDYIIFLQEHIFLRPLPTESYELTSKTLRKVVIQNAPSWELSKVENSKDSAHYTTAYLRRGVAGETLSIKDNNEIESIEKQYSEVEENNLRELEVLFHTKEIKSDPAPHHKRSSGSTYSRCPSSLKIKDHTSEKSDKDCYHEKRQINGLRHLSENLCAVIGKQTFSDIKIFSKEETVIPCHKIILLSRIPTMLKEIIKEDIGGRTNEMLMWNMEKHLCLVVLKYLYSGLIDHDTLNKLDVSQINELKQFCDVHHIHEVSKVVKNIETKMSNDINYEHFDDLTSENITENSNKQESLDKWLNNLKNRDSSNRRNFQRRFINIENKMKLDTEEKYTSCESSVHKKSDSKSTEREIIQTELTKPCSRIFQFDADTPSVDISKRNIESVENHDLKTFCMEDKTQENIYYFDCDIYDQETYVSVKSSETENVSNSDIEVRPSINCIYDKNTLGQSLENTKQGHTDTKKIIEMSQQTLNASPELFSDSDEHYDHGVLNVQVGKVNTQINLNKLINLMEDDISKCPRDHIPGDDKKRKRSPQISLENLKRSKQISNENRSSPRCQFLNTKVNDIYKHRETETQKSSEHFKIGDLISNPSIKTNLSIPCVAGFSKSRNAARNLNIDFDKIEVDTSAPLQAKTLNLTEENLMLFNKINEDSNDSFFERENPPMNDRILSSNTSSHGSSFILESYINKYKDSSKAKTISTLQGEKPEEANKSDSNGLKRKKSATPDFLKAKFYDPDIIEIKSSSEESTKWYPTKVISRHYKLSQRNKSITPQKHRTFHSQPQKKPHTFNSARSQSQKRFQSQNIKQGIKLSSSDSSDELSKIIKRKSERTRELSFRSISPISNIPCFKPAYENRRKHNSKSQTLDIAKEKSEGSRCNFQNDSFRNSLPKKPHRKHGISRQRNQDSSDSSSIAFDSNTCTSTSAARSSKLKYLKCRSHQRKSTKIKQSSINCSRRTSISCCSSPKSQCLQNSQFLKGYEEYFGINSKEKQIHENEILTKHSSRQIFLSIPKNGSSSLQNKPLSPDIIIQKPVVTSDSSSIASPTKQISNHYQQLINYEKVDIEYNEKLHDVSRTGVSLSTSPEKYKVTSTLGKHAKKTSDEINLVNTSLLKLDEKTYADFSYSNSKNCQFINSETKRSVSKSRSTEKRLNTVSPVSSILLSDSDHHSTSSYSDTDNSKTLATANKDSDKNKIEKIKTYKITHDKTLSPQSDTTSISNINTHLTISPNFQINIKKPSYSIDDSVKSLKIGIPKISTKSSDISTDSTDTKSTDSENESNKSSKIESTINRTSEVRKAEKRSRFDLSRSRSSALLSSPIFKPTFRHSQPSTSCMQKSRPSFSLTQSYKRELGRESVRNSLNDDVLEESLLSSKVSMNQLGATPRIETHQTKAATSTRKSLNETSIVTPLADYSAMETPLLKKELTKFGLKPSLGKGKAKLLLRYIYNQTHLYVDGEAENPVPNERENVKAKTINIPERCKSESDGSGLEKMPKKTAKKDKIFRMSQKRIEIKGGGCKGSDDESNSETSMGFPSDSQQVYEESIIFEQNLGCQEDYKVQSTPLFLSEVDKILRSEENYRKIVCYEPLWLEHLYKDLKQRGVRCNLKKLMDYLDEKCITFRTRRKKPSVKSKEKKSVLSQAIGSQLAQRVKKS